MKVEFEEFLIELAKAFDFSDLKPDRNGACLIIIKQDEIPLLFEYDESLVPNTVLVSCEICPIPQEVLSLVLEEALITNHTITETLSCKPDNNFLYLHKRFHPKIQSDDLRKSIDSITSEIRKWRSRVKEIYLSPEKKKEESPFIFKMQPFRA